MTLHAPSTTIPFPPLQCIVQEDGRITTVYATYGPEDTENNHWEESREHAARIGVGHLPLLRYDRLGSYNNLPPVAISDIVLEDRVLVHMIAGLNATGDFLLHGVAHKSTGRIEHPTATLVTNIRAYLEVASLPLASGLFGTHAVVPYGC